MLDFLNYVVEEIASEGNKKELKKIFSEKTGEKVFLISFREGLEVFAMTYVLGTGKAVSIDNIPEFCEEVISRIKNKIK